MEIILTLLICAAIVFVDLKKLGNTCRNTDIILDAIAAYRVDVVTNMELDRLDLVDYRDMRDIENVFLRFWDWGYKNILPPDKFELVKPYIEDGKGEKHGN